MARNEVPFKEFEPIVAARTTPRLAFREIAACAVKTMTIPLHTSTYTRASEQQPPAAYAAIAQALLAWYRRDRRSLPWRAPGDAYAVWVSEIMLQQTQVATVIGYYERWMRRFPDLRALAAAPTDEVLRAWEGLGYYSRAKNLQKAAREVLQRHAGELPSSIAELRRLPGIGPYSAGAIASIAFGAREPAVDGNVIRVLTRLFGLEGDPKRAPLRDQIWQLARELIPDGEAADFNQALMELGATRCTPRAARCELCPVRDHCQARRTDRVAEFPQTAPRTPPSIETRVAAVASRRGRVLVVRAPEAAARWAGMWQFPDCALPPDVSAAVHLEQHLRRSTSLSVAAGEQLASLRHQVTRFRITLEVYACRALAGRARPLQYAEARWCEPELLAALPMPAAHRKIARLLC